MPDLKDRFSLADEIEPPDLWSEARRRAAAPEAPPRSVEWPPARAAASSAAAVAFAVFAAAAVFAWDLSHPDVRPDATSRCPPSTSLPNSPMDGASCPRLRRFASGAATAWTGSQLLVWGGYVYVGGYEDPGADGFAFDARSAGGSRCPRRRSRVGRAARSHGRVEELLIWGGWDGGFRRPVPTSAMVPRTTLLQRTWRMLPAAPIEARTRVLRVDGRRDDRLGKHGQSRSASGRRGVRPDHRTRGGRSPTGRSISPTAPPSGPATR